MHAAHALGTDAKIRVAFEISLFLRQSSVQELDQAFERASGLERRCGEPGDFHEIALGEPGFEVSLLERLRVAPE